MPTFLHDGLRIAWREQGDGPLLLIVPGSTTSSVHHAGELEHFGRRFRAVALDLPGTGNSDRIDVWPDDWWPRGARCAAALVRHLGATSVTVAGTSGGAIVALHMAAFEPGLVRAVIADSCVPRYDPDLLRRAAVLRNIQTPAMVAFWHAGHGDDWEQVIRADGAFLERIAALGGDPFGNVPERVQCPVLFTASLGDELLGDIGEGTLELVRRVRGSQAHLVDRGGHPMMFTRAEAFRRAADAFLAEHEDHAEVAER